MQERVPCRRCCGRLNPVPDDVDYRQFGHLLRHPERWTRHDREQIGWLLEQQRQAIEAAHPKDRQGRARLQAIVTDIKSAIAVYDAHSAG